MTATKEQMDYWRLQWKIGELEEKLDELHKLNQEQKKSD